jgi:hypothetical protein
MSVHAEVNITGIDAVAFSVRHGNEERKNSKHQNDQSDCGQSSHAQTLRLL